MSEPSPSEEPPSDKKRVSPLTEEWWRDKQPWLKEIGYTLRPRYTPGWKPSWKGKPGIVLRGDYEDGQTLSHLQILDATAADGSRVCLKQVNLAKDPREPEIMQLLSSPPLSEDPANHCLPLKKTLIVPKETNLVLLVMPILRRWNSPPLLTIGETVEFVRQLFEAVSFLHGHGVAHRDIKWNNVMMDTSELFPDGFHFVKQDRTPDFSSRARYYSRTEKPPKYYLIDFGHAKQYDVSNGPPTDMPMLSGDETVPEHQPDRANQPCNPLKVDVYCTGNLLRQCFTEGYKHGHQYFFYPMDGFDFLKPLIADMVQDDPDKRPTMPEVVERFEKIRKSLSAWKLRSRLTEKREWAVVSLARSIPHWARTARYIARRLPPTPAI